MPTKKKKPDKRSVTKAKRQEHLAGLYRAGVPKNRIYAQMIAKFGVTIKTVRRDVHDLGNSAREYFETTAAVEAELGAAIERLKSRAADPDTPPNAANKADELLLNLLGTRSAKMLQKQIAYQTLKLKEAQEHLARERAEIAKQDRELREKQRQVDADYPGLLTGQISELAANGSVTYGDVLKLITVVAQAEMTKTGTPDSAKLATWLNMFFRLADVNPSTDLDGQHFRIPEGLLSPPPPDDGDNLLG